MKALCVAAIGLPLVQHSLQTFSELNVVTKFDIKYTGVPISGMFQ